MVTLLNGDFIFLSEYLNLICLSFLGIIILCLPLKLKQPLKWCFNIFSVLKACKQSQSRGKYFLPRCKLLLYMNALKSLLRIQCLFPSSPIIINQHVFLDNIFLIKKLDFFFLFLWSKTLMQMELFFSIL